MLKKKFFVLITVTTLLCHFASRSRILEKLAVIQLVTEFPTLRK